MQRVKEADAWDWIEHERAKQRMVKASHPKVDKDVGVENFPQQESKKVIDDTGKSRDKVAFCEASVWKDGVVMVFYQNLDCMYDDSQLSSYKTLIFNRYVYDDNHLMSYIGMVEAIRLHTTITFIFWLI